MQQRILFLDDSPTRSLAFKRNSIGANATIDYAQTAEHANELITLNTYDMIFLDHDLDICRTTGYAIAMPGNTGMDVVRHIIQSDNQKSAVIFVHTLNEEAGKEMVRVLENNKFEVYEKRFCWNTVTVDSDGNLAV